MNNAPSPFCGRSPLRTSRIDLAFWQAVGSERIDLTGLFLFMETSMSELIAILIEIDPCDVDACDGVVTIPLRLPNS
jgi:hypothetical protein